MNVLCVIQARYSSTRFPGKVLAKIEEKELICHLKDRLNHSISSFDHISYCFGIAEDDDERLEQFLMNRSIPFVKGSTKNVLMRFIEASKSLYENDIVVRFTADNPFPDCSVFIEMVEVMKNNPQYDYLYPYKLPLGMGFELIRVSALRKQLLSELKPHHTEHVSTYIKEHPQLFHIQQKTYFTNVPDIRLTIDYPEDLQQAIKTYRYFEQRDNPWFTSKDVYELHGSDQSFFSLNSNIEQKPPTSYEK